MLSRVGEMLLPVERLLARFDEMLSRVEERSPQIAQTVQAAERLRSLAIRSPKPPWISPPTVRGHWRCAARPLLPVCAAPRWIMQTVRSMGKPGRRLWDCGCRMFSCGRRLDDGSHRLCNCGRRLRKLDRRSCKRRGRLDEADGRLCASSRRLLTRQRRFLFAVSLSNETRCPPIESQRLVASCDRRCRN